MRNYLTHNLLDHPSINHGFFTRRGGVSTGIYSSLNAGPGSNDEPAKVYENRARIAKAIGAKPEHLLSLAQIHSRTALYVKEPFELANRPKADGLVTDRPGLALSALSADCGPVLFLDPEAQIIGACHAGWRGATSGITDAILTAMENIGARRENIRAVLGPCISQDSYEVGPEFEAALLAQDETYARFFRPGPSISSQPGRAHFDLKACIADKLARAGIGQIGIQPECTYKQPEDFFSYRYNTHQGISGYGRNISVIMLTQ